MPPRTNKIPIERIRILLRRAEDTHPTDPQLAERYIDLAKKIAMRTRTHIPTELRRRICRNCNTLIIPGINSRTRIRQRREPHVAITCLKCGHITRIPTRRSSP